MWLAPWVAEGHDTAPHLVPRQRGGLASRKGIYPPYPTVHKLCHHPRKEEWPVRTPCWPQA